MTPSSVEPHQPDVVETTGDAERLTLPPLLVMEPLAQYLDQHDLGSGRIEVRRIGQGHSNVTYELQRGDERIVLRRPPRQPYARSAHDMVREARFIAAISDCARVPKVIAVCEDEAVIGAPFYLMEYVDGEVIGPSFPKQVWAENDRSRLGAELVDTLVEIHAIPDPDSLLGRGRKSTDYLQRQISNFGKLWEEGKTREIKAVGRAARWLRENLPRSPANTIVHGDFRLGNAMFARSSVPRLKVMLDWEMATIGDPLADVGYMLAMWAEPGDPDTPMKRLSEATLKPGFPGRLELRQRYSARTELDLDAIYWYEVLALWKAAIFLEGSYRRYLAGSTDDPFFAELDEGVPALGDAIELYLEEF